MTERSEGIIKHSPFGHGEERVMTERSEGIIKHSPFVMARNES